MTGARPAPVAAALKGLCPRCGTRTLFAGPVAFAARCRTCELDYGAFNVGDGPAAILTLVLGALVVGLAIAIQLRFEPPVWVQVLVWAPITIALVVWSLRVTKAALLGAEYRAAAREGRIVS